MRRVPPLHLQIRLQGRGIGHPRSRLRRPGAACHQDHHHPHQPPQHVYSLHEGPPSVCLPTGGASALPKPDVPVAIARLCHQSNQRSINSQGIFQHAPYFRYMTRPLFVLFPCERTHPFTNSRAPPYGHFQNGPVTPFPRFHQYRTFVQIALDNRPGPTLSWFRFQDRLPVAIEAGQAPRAVPHEPPNRRATRLLVHLSASSQGLYPSPTTTIFGFKPGFVWSRPTELPQKRPDPAASRADRAELPIIQVHHPQRFTRPYRINSMGCVAPDLSGSAKHAPGAESPRNDRFSALGGGL